MNAMDRAAAAGLWGIAALPSVARFYPVPPAPCPLPPVLCPVSRVAEIILTHIYAIESFFALSICPALPCCRWGGLR